ncbi:CopG family transcriptional regulator [Halovenus salina]|uniref:CopG family transcriptional regulator n=1 Tax=Halovenus salina TaxID=1510225 RepID=A0ABD5W678_9EURY|nr:CopG family transcriptional regulator [Halovenus salina]
MASEELTVSVELSRGLVDWLDKEAAAADVDRGTMVSQLLASYQAVKQLEGEIEEESLLVDASDVAETVEANVAEELSGEVADAVDAAVEEAIETRIEELVTDRVTEATNGVQRQLGSRLDSVEAEFDEKIQDVRQRVIQLKQEVDEKAAADHGHADLDEVPELQGDIEELRAELDELREQHDRTVPDHSEQLANQGDRLEEMQNRLQTVAWVVSDLREAQQSSSGLEAVERIKRAAGQADIERATCEKCGDSVIISLLTDPHCPHCDATVTDVEPASGWFGNPSLTVASQLESGNEP